MVAKSARAATPDERAKQNAASYLEIEAYVNSKLCPIHNDTHHTTQQLQHVAPYLGEFHVNGKTYLLWEESGEYTLEDYIEMDDGWVQLADDLGLSIVDEGDNYDYGLVETTTGNGRQRLHNRLAAEVLRQILEGLAYIHSCGIVHRDIKVNTHHI